MVAAPKKALLIRMNKYDATQAIPRAARTLEELDYQVTILSFDNSGERPSESMVGSWRVINFQGTYESQNQASFIKAWLQWTRFVYQHLSSNSYDLVQASNVETVVPCILARRRTAFPLIFDIRDLWGMSLVDNEHGKWRSRFLSKVFRTTERWSAKRVDGMVLAPAPLDVLATYFGPHVTKNVPAAQVLNVPVEDFGEKYTPTKNSYFRVNYSGHISYLRNARAIIEFAQDSPSVVVDVVGDVPDQDMHAKLAALPNVNLYGRLPFPEAIDILHQADLILLTYDTSSDIAVISTPNKLFEAMMMGRPYVASEGGYPAKLAAENGIGWSIPYDDPQAIGELVQLLQDDPKLVDQAGERARTLFENSFLWSAQRANLVALYIFVTARSGDHDFTADSGWLRMLGTTINSRRDSIPAPKVSENSRGISQHVEQALSH